MNDIRDQDEFLDAAFPRNKYEILPFFSKTAEILQKKPSTHYTFIVSPLKYSLEKLNPLLKEIVLEVPGKPNKTILVAQDRSYSFIPSDEVPGTNPYIVISVFS